MTHTSRRDFLSAVAVTTAGAAALGATVPASAAQTQHTSKAPGQVPGVYRWTVGAITVTAIADGYSTLPLAIVPSATPEAADALAREAFLPTGDLPCIVNTFVIDTPSKRLLVDTGFGPGPGQHTGKIWENLTAAGITPAEIDALVLTHGHPDHIAGMLTKEGQAAFPNAELFVHAREHAYWTDEAAQSKVPDFQKGWFDLFRKSAAAYAKRTTLFDRNDQEIVGGVRVLELFGHTPGHSGLHLSDGDQEHLIWADIVHFPHLQFARPEWGVGFDVDPDLAGKARKTMLDRAAVDRIGVSGMHLAFPAVGHVVTRGNAYAFEQSRWQFDL